MRKAFNVTNKDTDILEHLAKQENISRYIIKLIRSDMSRGAAPVDEDYIESIVEKVLENKKLILESNNSEESLQNTSYSDEIQCSVKSILNI